jgi:hypothetical protein
MADLYEKQQLFEGFVITLPHLPPPSAMSVNENGCQ